MELVIMAAGMGSRFGGLKQVEPMNEDGDFIIDYSIFDAIRCGFNKVVFIIKEENYDLFRETVGKRIEDRIAVEYVFQKLEMLPKGFSVPEGRIKPWGTAHAILACKDVVKEDFVIINADDFYGYDAYKTASEFLKNKKATNKETFALVGYKVENTLSENGSAKRGVCTIENQKIVNIDECSIERINDKIIATPLDKEESYEIPEGTIVSMNMWCLTPVLFDYLEKEFPKFLEANIQKNPMKCEYLIPNLISEMSKEGLADIKVEGTIAEWYGVTYKEDKPNVVKALKELSDKGMYPNHLWK